MPIDEDGQQYLFEPGDMGTYTMVEGGVYADGSPVMVRRQLTPAKYTGGFNADGSPTLASLFQPAGRRPD